MPQVYRRPHPKLRGVWLEQRVLGIFEKNGHFNFFEHAVVFDGEVRADLRRSDWADWDHTGNLLWARDGCLYRARLRRRSIDLAEPSLVADLNPLTFSEVKPTRAAMA